MPWNRCHTVLFCDCSKVFAKPQWLLNASQTSEGTQTKSDKNNMYRYKYTIYEKKRTPNWSIVCKAIQHMAFYKYVYAILHAYIPYKTEIITVTVQFVCVFLFCACWPVSHISIYNRYMASFRTVFFFFLCLTRSHVCFHTANEAVSVLFPFAR